MPSWPATLPCIFQLQNTNVAPVASTLAIDPEVGEPLTRRRFTGEMDRVSGTFVFRTRALAETFLTFWRDDLKNGSLPFDFEHPITGDAVSMIFMAEPRLSANGRIWNAAVQLQTMP